MAFAHLSDATLDHLMTAAIDGGLASESGLDGLATGINKTFTAQYLTGANPNIKLLKFVNKMNETRTLVSGEVPLAKWLKNGIRLSGGTEVELVFRRALEEMSADGAPEAAAADLDPVRAADGTMEIAIGEDDTLGVEFLLRGAMAARSVVNLQVHRHFGGNPNYILGDQADYGLGTGWLIAPGLVITNHHVVAARTKYEPAASDVDFALQGENVLVDFDHVGENPNVIPTSATTCVASAPKPLDFAILRLAADKPDRPPLRLRTHPVVRAAGAALRERANVLQHPDGGAMRLGFRNNFLISASADTLSYLTDTDGGSSGSPICDDGWYVAGLHRGFRTLTEGPVLVWGKEIKQENYGTPIGQIMDHLAAYNPTLRQEIDAAQATLG